MHDLFMAEDSKLWDIVLDGPYVPMTEVKEGDTTKFVAKTRQQYS